MRHSQSEINIQQWRLVFKSILFSFVYWLITSKRLYTLTTKNLSPDLATLPRNI